MSSRVIATIRRPAGWTVAGLIAVAFLGMIADVVYVEAKQSIVVAIVLSVCILGIIGYFTMRFLHRER